MPRDFLHNHPQFADLIRIVAEEKGINPALFVTRRDAFVSSALAAFLEIVLSANRLAQAAE